MQGEAFATSQPRRTAAGPLAAPMVRVGSEGARGFPPAPPRAAGPFQPLVPLSAEAVPGRSQGRRRSWRLGGGLRGRLLDRDGKGHAGGLSRTGPAPPLPLSASLKGGGKGKRVRGRSSPPPSALGKGRTAGDWRSAILHSGSAHEAGRSAGPDGILALRSGERGATSEGKGKRRRGRTGVDKHFALVGPS